MLASSSKRALRSTSLCRSSFAWNSAPYDIPDMLSKPGTPCNDYNGYCDVFQRCREVIQPTPLFSTFFSSMEQRFFPFIFYLYIIDLNYIVRQHLIRLIRQGGSQRTTGNFEKTTLVGRQPSKLPTMDDRSLVHRCSNYPRLTVDLGKFSSVQFFSFYFERQKSRRTFFFNVILINIEKKKIHRAYFKSIDFGYQDKN